MLLKDSKVLRNLYQENQTLFERVRDWIDDFTAKVQAVFDGEYYAHLESTVAMKRAAADLQQMWDAALTDAAQTRAGIKNTATAGGSENEYSADRAKYAGADLANDKKLYSWEFLTTLSPANVIVLPEVQTVRDSNNRVDQNAVKVLGTENAKKVGKTVDEKTFVKNLYTGKDIRIDTSTIRHSINGNIRRLLTNARLNAVVGDIVQSAVPINALYNKAEGVRGTYAMAAYAVDTKGREFVAIVTIEQRSNEINSVYFYEIAHSVSGRQKNGSQANTKFQGVYPIKAAKICIADLLENVNRTYQSILSEDVLAHFNETRNPLGEYAQKAKFSAVLPASALETDEAYLSVAEKYRDGTATEEETEQLRQAQAVDALDGAAAQQTDGLKLPEVEKIEKLPP